MTVPALAVKCAVIKGFSVKIATDSVALEGALGSCGYLSYLAFNVFKNSWLFPVAMMVIGFVIIYLGVLWQKHEKAMVYKAGSLLSAPLRELLEAKA